MNKKAMELPLNMVIMIIIGIIIFGLGMALFNTIASESDEIISDLNKQIKTGISAVECQNNAGWICVPRTSVKTDKHSSSIYITNRGEKQSFKISLKQSGNPINTGTSLDADCGKLIIYFPTKEVEVNSGEVMIFPFEISANLVKKTPCNFILTAEALSIQNGVMDTTPMIISVEK